MVDQYNRVILITLALFFTLFGYTFSQQTLNSRVERLALLQLRSSLGLRSKEWPIKSDPCTLWIGIQCTNGRITGINISGFKRTRIGNQNPQFSVDALKSFTLLSSFNASNFAIPGPIPDWFGSHLRSLRVLDLRSCLVKGVIPSTLGNLSSLVELHLSNNNLTGVVPSSLGQLFGLSVFDLSRNLLTGFVPLTLTSLRNLTVFDISSNFLSGEIPVGFGSLLGLRVLNLSGNSLSSSIPGQLGNLSSLVDLDLGFNSISGSIPTELGGLRNLQRLILGNNLFSGALSSTLFPSLTQLQLLDLNNNGFNGDFPDVLWSMPSLRFLDVSMNNFTGILPNVSTSANAAIAVFNISHNLFYGNLTPVIRRFGFIDMSANYFEGPVPVYARGDTSLGGNCLRNLTSQRNRTDCASFYADRNLVFDNFGERNVTLNPRHEKRSHKSVIIIASVIGGIGFILLLVVIILALVFCKPNRGTSGTNQRGTIVGPVSTTGENPQIVGPVSLNLASVGDSFTYQQILDATGEFNDANLIKNGYSGDLYSGKIEGEIPVVIKRIDLNSSVKREAYMLEMDVFSKVSHARLVPILGHCLENENEKFIVYKYMPNGDLSSALFKKTSSEDDSLQSLDWIIRMKIAIGAAEGLSYLHHECTPPLVHRDVQASSILLDDKYDVRLGSLSKVCAQEGEIHQSRMTRLLRLPQTSGQGASGTPNATCAYDVYCFGKVLLELVTGKLGFSSSSDPTTKDWLEATLPNISIYNKDLVTNIVDPTLVIDEDLLEEVWAMSIVARSCLNPKPTRRPLMRYILKALENPIKVVRDENASSGSARLRTNSSRGSWNAAIFASWRHSSSDVAATSAGPSRKVEGGNSFKQSKSSGSGGNGHSSSSRRHSSEIFPEPLDVERGNEE